MPFKATIPYTKPYTCTSMNAAQAARYNRNKPISDGYKFAIMQIESNQDILTWVEQNSTSDFTYDFDPENIIFTFESEQDYNAFVVYSSSSPQ